MREIKSFESDILPEQDELLNPDDSKEIKPTSELEEELGSEKTINALYGFIRTKLPRLDQADVDEVIQDTLKIADEQVKKGKLKKGGSLLSYLKTITYRTAIDKLRRQNLEKKYIQVQEPQDIESMPRTNDNSLHPESLVAEKRRIEMYRKILAECSGSLNNMERKVMNLYLDGLTNTEISKKLGMNIKTVGVHLFKVRKK